MKALFVIVTTMAVGVLLTNYKQDLCGLAVRVCDPSHETVEPFKVFVIDNQLHNFLKLSTYNKNVNS